WLRAEARVARWTPGDIDLGLALSRRRNPADARTLAAYAVYATLQNPIPAQLLAHLNGLQAYLDDQEASLPVRAAWLARTALGGLAGGDVLGLARTRDRLLDRLLHTGLSLDLDTPTFLRFASSGASDRLQAVRRWLTDKREPIRAWVTQMGG